MVFSKHAVTLATTLIASANSNLSPEMVAQSTALRQTNSAFRRRLAIGIDEVNPADTTYQYSPWIEELQTAVSDNVGLNELDKLELREILNEMSRLDDMVFADNESQIRGILHDITNQLNHGDVDVESMTNKLTNTLQQGHRKIEMEKILENPSQYTLQYQERCQGHNDLFKEELGEGILTDGIIDDEEMDLLRYISTPKEDGSMRWNRYKEDALDYKIEEGYQARMDKVIEELKQNHDHSRNELDLLDDIVSEINKDNEISGDENELIKTLEKYELDGEYTADLNMLTPDEINNVK